MFIVISTIMAIVLVLLLPVVARAALSETISQEHPVNDMQAHVIHLPAWLPEYLTRRSVQLAEKRHQMLFPYHPVVRFRGLGGPGESWHDGEGGAEDIGALIAALSPFVNGDGASVDQALLNELAQNADEMQADGVVNKVESLSAGEFLALLESMVGLHEDVTRSKGIRFGLNRRRRRHVKS